MSTLRIRDSATVRELNIPKEVLEELEKIISSKKSDDFKKIMIKKLARASPAAFAAAFPLLKSVLHLVRAAQRGLSDIARGV